MKFYVVRVDTADGPIRFSTYAFTRSEAIHVARSFFRARGRKINRVISARVDRDHLAIPA